MKNNFINVYIFDNLLFSSKLSFEQFFLLFLFKKFLSKYKKLYDKNFTLKFDFYEMNSTEVSFLIKFIRE